MNAVVLGCGYVGLATGVSLAHNGHRVACLDIDAQRIVALRQGRVPFFEAGLREALLRQVKEGRLSFHLGLQELPFHPQVILVCVGTPEDHRGATDLSQVMGAVRQIRDHPFQQGPIVVAIKSTVPVGTCRRLEELLKQGSGARLFHLASNPEFLREGAALADCLAPSRIVIGTRDEEAASVLKSLYAKVRAPVLLVAPEDAELIKHASNAFLACKISFVNAMAELCERVGADIRAVTAGMGLDPRIGPAFLAAGLGFGGSCFPKDLNSLAWQFREAGLSPELLDQVMKINRRCIERAVAKLRRALGSLAGRSIALWGLAFKPGTDDVRRSQSLRLAERLLAEGCRVRAYDPRAMDNARRELPQLCYCASPYDAAAGADALVVATDWPEFNEVSWRRVLAAMRERVVLDARNALQSDELIGLGARYLGMGWE